MQSRTGSRSTHRRLAILLALFVGLLLILWCTGAFLGLGHMAVRQALDSGDDKTAERRIAYVGWVGRSAETSFLQARLARHRGDYQEMSRLLDQAAAARYDRRKLGRETMLAQAQIGQLTDEAESKINAWILEGGADTREVCAAYTNGLAASSRFEEAIRILKAWSADYPSDPRPHFRLGRIFEHQRRQEDALEQYRIATERDPKFVPAAYSQARILFDQRKVDEALAAFESCPNADRSIPVQVSIAVCNKAQANVTEARRILENVLKHPVEKIEQSYRDLQEPAERFIAATELGKIESDEGNFEAAKTWLEKAVTFNARDMEARYAYAVALRGLGQQDQADKEFEYVKRTREALASVNIYWDRVQGDARDTEARLHLARIFIEHESIRNGLYWLKSIEAYDPDNAQVAAFREKYAEYLADDPGRADDALPDAYVPQPVPVGPDARAPAASAPTSKRLGETSYDG